MSQNPRYREQIDACRPGSDDLALPALADLATAAENDRALAGELARSQRFDRAVSVALHDVALPAGLLERLEAKLAAGDAADPSESSVEVALPATRSHFSRRKMFAVAASLAAVALLAIGGMFWPRPSRHIANDDLSALANTWFNQQLPATGWKPLSTTPAPARFAVPTEVGGAKHWQSFSTPDGQMGVVFDLTRGLRPQARLFVIASNDKFDVQLLPFTRLKNTTGNVAIGAWHRNGLLYVVVVSEEGGQKLEDFVQPKGIVFAPGSGPVHIPAARPA